MFGLHAIFWGSALTLGYTYFGYPLALAGLARGMPRPWQKASDASMQAAMSSGQPSPDFPEGLPSVTLLIAAWNEARVIEAKLQNALAIAYPTDRLRIVVASDGSNDETVAIARRFEAQGVQVLDLPRGGKTSAINRAMEQLAAEGLTSELLVFSDANVFFEPDALQKLVRHFVDPQIGGVSGDVRLKPDGFSLGESQGLYYRYERWIQTQESRIGSIIGADGGMYAIRRALFRPIPTHLINDDFILSMEVVRQGFRLIYDPEAVAFEDSPVDSANEFKRKIRVEHGNFQALFSGYSVPHRNQPLALFCYFSHKVARWLGFVPLSLALGSSIGLAPLGGLPLLAAVAQGGFYGLAFLGWQGEKRMQGSEAGSHAGSPAGSHAPTHAPSHGHAGTSSRTQVPFYFTLENLAALRGLHRLLTTKAAPGSSQWGTAATRSRTV